MDVYDELDNEMFDDEDATYVRTPHSILYDLISDEYGFDVGRWTPKLWEHIFEDFMEELEKAGYVSKKEETE